MEGSDKIDQKVDEFVVPENASGEQLKKTFANLAKHDISCHSHFPLFLAMTGGRKSEKWRGPMSEILFSMGLSGLYPEETNSIFNPPSYL